MSGGARAADLAVKTVADAFERGFDVLAPRCWTELLIRADTIVASDPDAGEATIVVVAVTEHCRVVGASCGDSGAVIVGTQGRIDDLARR